MSKEKAKADYKLFMEKSIHPLVESGKLTEAAYNTLLFATTGAFECGYDHGVSAALGAFKEVLKSISPSESTPVEFEKSLVKNFWGMLA